MDRTHLKLSRRRVLQHGALAALVAPVLRRRDAHGAPTAPRRLVLVFSGNGPIATIGPASGTETSFTIHDWWKPLERHRADAIFMSHLAITGSKVVNGDAHGLGGQLFAGYGVQNVYASKGPTIDQIVAQRLESQGRAGLRRSVVWGLAKGATGEGFQTTGGRNLVPEVDPSKAWTDLFASFVAPAAAPGASPSDAARARAMAMIARQQSVLDIVNADCQRLRDGLGAEGVRLLDEHCTTLRGMEKNLQVALTGTPALASCRKPANPGAMTWTNPDNIDAQGAAFTDLIATSLACELTYVVAFQLSGQAARNRLGAKYGVPSAPVQDSGDSGPAHHPWTHNPQTPERVAALQAFTSFYATQVALLVDKLKSTVDATGAPLLDSTVVLWGSELGGSEMNPSAHLTGCVPMIWFGKGQGQFRTGRYLKSSTDNRGLGAGVPDAGRDMARILVSAVQYMGLTDVDTVGVTGVKGPFTPLQG